MKAKNKLLLLLLTGLVTPSILTACEWPEPEQIRANLHLPSPDFVADAERGKKLFDDNCIRCHGGNGRGTRAGPPLVHNVYRPGHHADLSFHFAVRDGVRQHHWNFGHMAPVDGLSAEDVGHIVAYVRQEQQSAGIK